MKALNRFAMVTGYFVAALWLLGVLGVGDFALRFGPTAQVKGKQYTCHSGDGFWSRRKYVCDFEEFTEREAAGTNAP